jgi:hypothetical protein
MASTATKDNLIDANPAIESFQSCIKQSTRVLALLGAGLSASSGLPTFRGSGGLWRTHDAMELATPEAFAEHPALVWQFYNYRRHMALKAKPNAAHFALAELAKRMEGFQTLSQNVDGASVRFHLFKFEIQNKNEWKLTVLFLHRALTTSRTPTRQAASPPRFALRYQMHRFLLQILPTRQLHRPNSPRPRNTNR